MIYLIGCPGGYITRDGMFTKAKTRALSFQDVHMAEEAVKRLKEAGAYIVIPGRSEKSTIKRMKTRAHREGINIWPSDDELF